MRRFLEMFLPAALAGLLTLIATRALDVMPGWRGWGAAGGIFLLVLMVAVLIFRRRDASQEPKSEANIVRGVKTGGEVDVVNVVHKGQVNEVNIVRDVKAKGDVTVNGIELDLGDDHGVS